MIDGDDYDVWKSHFGETLPLPGAGGGASAQLGEVEAPAEPLAVNGSAGASPSQIPLVDAGIDPRPAAGATIRPWRDAAAMVRSLRTARHDNALLAWLASQTSAARGRYDGDSERWADDRPADESDAGLLERVDAVFQLVGSGG